MRARERQRQRDRARETEAERLLMLGGTHLDAIDQHKEEVFVIGLKQRARTGIVNAKQLAQ